MGKILALIFFFLVSTSFAKAEIQTKNSFQLYIGFGAAQGSESVIVDDGISSLKTEDDFLNLYFEIAGKINLEKVFLGIRFSSFTPNSKNNNFTKLDDSAEFQARGEAMILFGFNITEKINIYTMFGKSGMKIQNEDRSDDLTAKQNAFGIGLEYGFLKYLAITMEYTYYNGEFTRSSGNWNTPSAPRIKSNRAKIGLRYYPVF